VGVIRKVIEPLKGQDSESPQNFRVDELAMGRLARELAQDLTWDSSKQGLEWQGMVLGSDLDDPTIAGAASLIAKMAGVREALLDIQRTLALAAPRGIFVDGRDIGTVVFPDAELKIFFTASLEVRAKRRLDQLTGPTSGAEVALEEIRNAIAYRDHQDQSRQSAPLKKADDAIKFDTSLWSFEESVAQLIALIQKLDFC
jgi:cytidylate kinase